MCCDAVSELVIAIDGPAGSGKSTVSRLIAERLGIPHLDTGAFYRTATLAVLDDGVDPGNPEGVLDVVKTMDMEIGDATVLLEGRDVTRAIRSASVSDQVSVVSAHPAVRTILVDAQRRWVEERGGSCVAEGRDIGTVVFPQADLKIYLDANPDVRAARRAEEMPDDPNAGADLERRDRFDSSRTASPLAVADDAHIVDTSRLSIDEVVGRIVDMVD
ncbi:MAG: (d)CMP kinase [Acidimicrobiia bacterium]|nr:(d)CMP kinase [Acidimicrobiia bacterium]